MRFMNRKELLKKYYDLETHNALCYSENLFMTKPKKGYEKEWKEAMERVDALDALMQESEAKTPYANQINKGTEENYGRTDAFYSTGRCKGVEDREKQGI